MTDDERADISNAIWLCRSCAKLIDNDAAAFPVELLLEWRRSHEQGVAEGRRGTSAATREIEVSGGGIGSIINHTGAGPALEVIGTGPGPAERISVRGSGVGEIITSTGPGPAKRVVSHGNIGSQYIANAGPGARRSSGFESQLYITSCPACGNGFQARRTIGANVDGNVPSMQLKCQACGHVHSI